MDGRKRTGKMSSDAPVWLITGTSTGFGRNLAELLIERGRHVVATAREPAKLEELHRKHPKAALVLKLDITERAQIDAAVAEAKARFGRIDVLVNNAGRGYLAGVEEGDEDEIRALFEVNFFGHVWMTQAVLPIMRAQRSGTIVNISSIGGLTGNLGHSYYGATKFAIEGFSDALAKEVEPLGIRVLVVEPGPFRTSFFTHNVRQAKNRIADYAETVLKRNRGMIDRRGKEPGDPRLAAELIVAAVEAGAPTLRLPLGKLAIDNARAKLREVLADIDHWEERSLATDRPPQ